MRTLLLLLTVLLTTPVLAQGALSPGQREDAVKAMREALLRDPSILRDALAALQADDARRQDKVTSDVIAMLGPHLVSPADPVAGNPFGDVTVVEFFDTRCPYCRKMPSVLAELAAQDRQVRLVMKDLPILGPSSMMESRALLAVQKQGGYFKMQEAAFQLSGVSTRDSLRDLADRLGLDGNAMLRDMDDPAIKARLAANTQLAQQLGIEGTPAFIIGQRMIPGAADLGELQRAVVEARAQGVKH